MHDLHVLRSDLALARSRYEARYLHGMASYRKALWRRFQQELNQVLSFLIRDRNIAVVNETSRLLLYQSIMSEAEKGMDCCVWGPPLGLYPLHDLCYGLMAYGILSAMNHALTHQSPRENPNPFFDYLNTSGIDERTAGAVCIMACTALLNAVAQTCLANHLPAVAQIVMRTSQHCAKAPVTRSARNAPLPGDPHEIIIMREEMPRLMMLEHVFFRTLTSKIRFPLLEIASDIHLFLETTRHLEDADDPRIHITVNAGRDDRRTLSQLMDRAVSIRTHAAGLDPDCRDAVDVRVEKGLERMAEWLASKQMHRRIARQT